MGLTSVNVDYTVSTDTTRLGLPVRTAAPEADPPGTTPGRFLAYMAVPWSVRVRLVVFVVVFRGSDLLLHRSNTLHGYTGALRMVCFGSKKGKLTK